ncbi:F-box protein At5g03100-like [Asparagus officinalis]|uniref:F-box protein At5g03100-like n=1 Tax=Asparagus officinalis TaxID=4686 RepID=UPI00098DECCB|nr:F-box protein At5g03100-like [Asparagus officinalis]
MDAFSLLPDHLISSILSFLPLTIAARTSVLSRRWRPLWAHITAFNVDADRLFPSDSAKQIRCIDAILSHPQLNILELKIALSSCTPAPVLARWAVNLARRRVTNVGLISVDQPHLALQTLFTSKSLTKLELQYCKLNNDGSSPLVACSSLKLIELKAVTTSNETISEILSACKNLNSLRIEYCSLYSVVVSHQRLECFELVTGLSRCDINIETPNLRELELDVPCNVKRIRVLAPIVRRSRVGFQSGLLTCGDLLGSLTGLVAGIENAEELQLCGAIVQVGGLD